MKRSLGTRERGTKGVEPASELPAGEQQTDSRENMVVMPVGELLERTDNMRREWKHEFHMEFAKANGMLPPDPVYVNGAWVQPPDDPNRKRAVKVEGVPSPSPPTGWGHEWQRRAEEKAKEKLKKELGFKD